MPSTKNDPLWVREFDWDYAIPFTITKDPELEDMSWHNDSAPSFALKGREATAESDIRLFVEHPNMELRASEGAPRYLVVDTATQTTLYDGSAVRKAIRALQTGECPTCHGVSHSAGGPECPDCGHL